MLAITRLAKPSTQKWPPQRKPAKVTGETEEGHFECVACLLYGYLLTLTTFEVRKDGTVDIIKDQPLDGVKVTVNETFS